MIIDRQGKPRLCSLQCYWAWKRAHPEELPLQSKSKRVKKRCKICGNEFETHRYYADKAQFCSISCMHEARRKYPIEADKNEWHEIKGYPREKGMEKIRRFRDLYPNERLVVIGRKEMKAIILAL